VIKNVPGHINDEIKEIYAKLKKDDLLENLYKPKVIRRVS
jgi:hypothetical protein